MLWWMLLLGGEGGNGSMKANGILAAWLIEWRGNGGRGQPTYTECLVPPDLSLLHHPLAYLCRGAGPASIPLKQRLSNDHPARRGTG
jgi:hypothetical protein